MCKSIAVIKNLILGNVFEQIRSCYGNGHVVEVGGGVSVGPISTNGGGKEFVTDTKVLLRGLL